MPLIMPIKELRNTNEISNLAHKEQEPIFITKNGKVVAKLSNPHQDRVDIAKSLFGILPADVTLEEAKEERLNRI